jgi:hypothetical protein
MAASTAPACTHDGSPIVEHQKQVEVAGHDDKTSGHHMTGEVKPTHEELCYNAKFAAMFVSPEAGLAAMPETIRCEETEASSSGAVRVSHPCNACLDHFSWFEVIVVTCGHEYCRDCLEQLFRSSLTDEQLFPPKCCKQAVSVEHREITLFVSKVVLDQYPLRAAEVASTDRTYCRFCGVFILAECITGRSAKCAQCSVSTCAQCKNEFHDGPCPEDEALKLLKTTAHGEGWRQCQRCYHMIELTDGCYHIT